MNLGLPNQALETTEFCAWVLSLRFSLLLVPPSVSQLGRSATSHPPTMMDRFFPRRTRRKTQNFFSCVLCVLRAEIAQCRADMDFFWCASRVSWVHFRRSGQLRN